MTKVISLSNNAYAQIKSLKGTDESFSDVVIRLSAGAKQKPLDDFFGKWPGTAPEAIEIKKKIDKERKLFKTRDVNF